jgi:CBS domain-containing protein
MLITADDLLAQKGHVIVSIDPDKSVYEALKLLAENNIGALLVFKSEKLIGVFSERDYARKLALKGKFSKDTAIREVMTENVITVSSDCNLEQCMEVMTYKHIRHLPVVQDGRVTGIISIGDIVKAIISDQKSTIGFLEDYIKGGR